MSNKSIGRGLDLINDRRRVTLNHQPINSKYTMIPIQVARSSASQIKSSKSRLPLTTSNLKSGLLITNPVPLMMLKIPPLKLVGEGWRWKFSRNEKPAGHSEKYNGAKNLTPPWSNQHDPAINHLAFRIREPPCLSSSLLLDLPSSVSTPLAFPGKWQHFVFYFPVITRRASSLSVSTPFAFPW